MKKITKFLMLLIAMTGISTNAQVLYEGLDKTYTEVMDSLLTYIDKSDVNTGILYDRVFSLYDITEREDDDQESSNFWDFSQRLHELRLASYQPIYGDVKEMHRQLKENEKVYIGVINSSVNYIDYGTEEDPNLILDNGYFTVVPGRNPIREEQVTLLAPLKEYVYAEQVTFAIDPQYLFQHTANPIKSIEVDFGDGTKHLLMSDYNLIPSDITIDYRTEGKKSLSFKIDFANGAQKWKVSDLTIVFPVHIDDFGPFQFALEENFTNHKGITPSNVDNIAFKGYNETNASAGQLEYRTYYNKLTNDGTAPSKINKPIIILDGFDPGDKRKIYQGSTNYNPDSKSIYELMEYDPDNNPTTENNVNLVQQLRSAPYGFDVTLVNFQEGADYIERNAMALVALIKRENARLAANGSDEELIIVGPSMGGLISRYALSYMEKNHIPHNTRLWVSFDSPHLGANIPIGAQENLYFFGYNGNQIEAKVQFDENFRSPAARQMLVEQLDALHSENANETLWSNSANGQNNQTPFRNQFGNSLSSIGNFGTNGFPQNLRKIALINGTTNGTKTNGEGQIFLELAAFAKFLGADVKAVAMTDRFMGNTNVQVRTFDGYLRKEPSFPQIGGSYRGIVTRTNTNPRGVMDIVQGGTFNTGEIIKSEFHKKLEAMDKIKKIEWRTVLKDHSFIPSVSALAFKNSNFNWANALDRNLVCDSNNKEIHFDSYFAPSKNEEHIHLTKENVDWLLKEFMDEPQDPHFPLSANLLQGPETICVNQTSTYYFADACKIPGAVVEWITSPQLSVISSTENSVVVKGLGLVLTTETPKVTAVFANGQRYSKDIHVGAPYRPSVIFGNDVIYVNQGGTLINPSRTYSISPVSQATYYEWQLPGNFVTVNQLTPEQHINNNWELLASTANSHSVEVKSNLSTDGYIRVRACNDCGCSNYRTLYVEHIGQNSGGYFDIYPNPTGGITTISLVNENNYPSFNNGQTTVHLYNTQAILVKTFQISERGGQFDVSNLPTGIYKVQIDLQNGSYQLINLKVSR